MAGRARTRLAKRQHEDLDWLRGVLNEALSIQQRTDARQRLIDATTDAERAMFGALLGVLGEEHGSAGPRAGS